MDNKFIRIISPITLGITLIFDASAVALAVLAVRKLQEKADIYSILFAVMEVFVLILAVLMIREVVRHGVKFKETEFEFTALDDNNIFAYADIEGIETQRDDKASLTKNFDDRHSIIILTIKGGKTVTVDIGLTGKKKLLQIKNEIEQRCSLQA